MNRSTQYMDVAEDHTSPLGLYGHRSLYISTSHRDCEARGLVKLYFSARAHRRLRLGAELAVIYGESDRRGLLDAGK
ncbi:hypothetical protein EVAR_79622_1 [Eumeta japonica]|uniref:Uncharacterized protein n=1 Tax=Eumeta variegata TaxID=151549 RepID=A0A4C1UEA6_EUMVA|nr:hypothetical protein EVAR_79622_1 [Eumeta japonica]